MPNFVLISPIAKTNKKSELIFSFQSDGIAGDETDVRKIDISTLGKGNITRIKINRITWSMSEGTRSIRIFFERSGANNPAIELSGNGSMNLEDAGGLRDPAPDGGSGDILFSTLGFGSSAGAAYTVQMDIEAIEFS